MNRVLKTVLLWLMIAALPVQGIAAVVKASCDPSHHSIVSNVAVADHRHDDHAVHHHHDHDGMQSLADGSPSDEPMKAETSSGTFKSSYCSACAACCVGAAAPPTAAIVPALHSSSESVLVSPASLVTGYIPDGLKRPPRPISA